jgi:tripartite-type tricarboxylate transporter receptor subunit TctC
MKPSSMGKSFSSFLNAAALVAGMLIAGAAASQQAFPQQPVRLIVPMAPGGGADISMRMLTARLQQAWPQGVFVDNRAGGTGAVGLVAAKNAKPDGYTLVVGTASHAVVQSTQAGVPYDLVKDFEPVTQLTAQPYVLVVNPATPARDVQQLLQLSNQQSKGLTYSSAGAGSLQQIAGTLLASMGKGNFMHVPYKGGGPAIAAAVAGEVDMVFATPWEAQPFIESGKLRALAVSSARRLPSLPNVPTMREAGLPGFEATQWYGILVPAGTPRDVIARLHAEFTRVATAPDMVERFAKEGIEIVASSPREFGEFIQSELQRSKRLAALFTK